jgi:hypothetical protein
MAILQVGCGEPPKFCKNFLKDFVLLLGPDAQNKTANFSEAFSAGNGEIPRD